MKIPGNNKFKAWVLKADPTKQTVSVCFPSTTGTKRKKKKTVLTMGIGTLILGNRKVDPPHLHGDAPHPGLLVGQPLPNLPPVGARGGAQWMDEILHHFETMGNHCWLIFTGESSF